MNLIFIVGLLSLSLASVVIERDANAQTREKIAGSLSLLLLTLCVFKSGEMLPDYNVYISIANGTLANLNQATYEPVTRWVSSVSSKFSHYSHYVFFFIYGCLSVLLTRKSILIGSPSVASSFSIWIANFFILHGLIQLRAGAAIAIMTLAILKLDLGRKYYFALALICSSLVHYSALVFLIFAALVRFLKYPKVSGVGIILAIIIGNYSLDILNLFFEAFQIELTGKYVYFSQDRVSKFSVELFGPIFVLKCLLFLTTTFTYSALNRRYRFFPVFYAMNAFGLMSFASLIVFPEVAVRVSQLFFISEIFLVPMLASIIRPLVVGYVFLVGWAGAQLVANVLLTNYFSYSLSSI